MRRLQTAAIAALALLALAGPTSLQAQPVDQRDTEVLEQFPRWGWGPGMMEDADDYRGPMRRGRGFGPGRMMRGPTAFIEGRIAFLRAELVLTDAQKPLFDTYAQALREAAASMQSTYERTWSRDQPQRLPERLQLRLDAMNARVKALEGVKAAALPLYEALSSEQKDQADRLIGPMGMM
jgi:hypothetical protein